MKITYYYKRSWFGGLYSTMRLVKIIIVLLVFGIGNTFALTYSQTTLLSLDINKQSVKEVIDAIEQQSEYVFFFAEDVRKEMNRKVDITVNNKTIHVILDQLFAGTDMKYTIHDRQVSILKTGKTKHIPGPAMEQQSRKVTGKVIDNSGEELIGVNVVIKGTTIGVVTDINGNYSIDLPNANAVLVFSFIGYITHEEQVSGQSVINVTLKEDTQALEEVVVIGYGTVAKKDLTGAVATVKPKELTAFTVSDPIHALQGRVPGVAISQNTGDPSGDYSIRIRGINSIKGDNSPLYIIDGIPSSTASINTYDIESLEVLKDASATAIYGSRGANGVVLITTKRGKAGKTNVTYDFEYGIQSQIKRADLMNAQEWARFYNEYLVNAEVLETAPFSEADINAMGKGTDWQKLMFENAPVSNHSLNVSGGAENVKYYVSGSALMRDGLLQNSSYNKYNVRSSLDFTISPMVDAYLQLGYSSIKNMNQKNEGGNGGSSMIGAIYSASPVFVPFDEDGNYKDLRSWYSWSSHEIRNPMAMAYESTYQTVTNLMNLNAAVVFKPIKGLSIKGTLGLESSDARYDAYTTSKYIYQNNTATVRHNRYNLIVNEDIVNYNFTINNAHKFDIMGGFTYQEYTDKLLEASGNTFLSDVTETHNLGAAGTVDTPETKFSKWVLMSYLGRVNYSYKGKYLATASFRADGSSRYSPGQRWGYFPSGAVAWRISDEAFMENFDNLSDMKIRVGYGQTGSTAVDPYQTQNLLESGKTATGNGNYTYYAPGDTYPGMLKWETTSQWDVGVDVGLFNHRIRITADYYYKLTKDLLNTVYLPTSSGYSSTTRNIGSMSNRGVEFLIDADIIQTKDFGFTAQFNIAHNKNRVEELADGADIFGRTYTNYGTGSITIIREGEPLGAFYVYKDDGLSEEGRLSYVDFNDDGQYTDDADRYVAGSPYPDFTYGLNCGFRYKEWEFSFFLQGSQGNDVFNLSEMRNYSYSQGMNIERHVFANSWRAGQDNSKAQYPRIESVGSIKYSDRFVENGSYLRLKNISLAYNLPCRKWATKNWLQSARVFVSAQNFLTITGYKGIDPEVSSKLSDGHINAGIDHLSYPPTKTFSFGLKVEF